MTFFTWKKKFFQFLSLPERQNFYSLLAFITLGLVSLSVFLFSNHFLSDTNIFDDKQRFLFLFPAIGLYLLIQSKPDLPRLIAITKGAFALIIIYGLAAQFTVTYKNIVNPWEWDFLCWYVDGKLAVSGLNFYDLDNYKQVFTEAVVPAIPLTPSQNFLDETVNLGFLYFPQAIILYYPLGLMDFDTAHLAWAILNYIFFFGCIFLTKQLFFQKFEPKLGLMFSAAFWLLYPSTMVVFRFDQNHFILIFFLLMAMKTIADNRTGIWLALAVCIKPVSLIFGLFLLVKQRWKAIFTGALTGLLVTVLTIVLFGYNTVMGFFTENPHVNVPDFMYTQESNLSILSVILRQIDFDYVNQQPTRQPLYLAIAGVLTALTVLFMYRLPKKHNFWGLSLVLALTVVIYPGSLVTYSIFLIFPFLLLLQLNDESILSPQIIFILLSLFSAFLLVRMWSVFYANVMMWALTMYVSFKLSKVTEKEPELSEVHAAQTV